MAGLRKKHIPGWWWPQKGEKKGPSTRDHSSSVPIGIGSTSTRGTQRKKKRGVRSVLLVMEKGKEGKEGKGGTFGVKAGITYVMAEKKEKKRKEDRAGRPKLHAAVTGEQERGKHRVLRLVIAVLHSAGKKKKNTSFFWPAERKKTAGESA